MTKEPIMIDDVDVSGCEYLQKDFCNCVGHLLGEYDRKPLAQGIYCENNPKCYYKQLKRKEQECESLKDTIKLQNEMQKEVCEEKNKEIDQLKAECGEWKNKYYASTTETKADLIKQIEELKKDNDEIHKRMATVIYRATGGHLSYSTYTLDAIEQAREDRLAIDVERKTEEYREVIDQLKKNNEELERENKKLKSIIKQAIEDFNLEIGTPQYEILLNKSKELGVIKE